MWNAIKEFFGFGVKNEIPRDANGTIQFFTNERVIDYVPSGDVTIVPVSTVSIAVAAPEGLPRKKVELFTREHLMKQKKAELLRLAKKHFLLRLKLKEKKTVLVDKILTAQIEKEKCN